MIITQVPEDDKDGHGDGATIQLQTLNNAEVASSRFWGVKLSPQQPVTVTFRNRPYNFLHISQATLGEVCGGGDSRENSRCGVLSKIGDNPEVLICSLRLKYKEMASLSLDFDGPDNVVFSVNGPMEIHLVGYFFYHPSPTTIIPPLQLVGNGENNAAGKNEVGICSSGNGGGCVASEHQLISVSNEGGMCKQVAPKLDLVSQMDTPPLHDKAVDVADGSNKIRKDGGISILVQGLTQTQFEAFGESMVEKLQGSSKPDSCQNLLLDSKEAKKAKTTLKKKLKKHRKVEDEYDSAANDDGLQTLVSDSEVENSKKHGIEDDSIRSTKGCSSDYHVLQSRKSKRVNKRKNHDDEEQDDHFRSTKQYSGQNLELDSKKATKSKKQKRVEDDDHRPHDLSEDVALDTREAKKAMRKPKQKVVQEEVRVVNDGQQTLASNSGEVNKSKENIVEDDSIRFAQHDDIPRVDSGKAKKGRKKEKEVVEKQARSHESQQVPIVYALPCQGKR